MRKRQKPINLLLSKTRQHVLTATHLRPDRWWYMSELAGHLGVRASSLQLELPALESGELLVSRRDGNRIYYKANSASPLFISIQQILLKTVGLADVITDALKSFEKKISLAFIYGSIARGEEISTSDVDLLIVGSVRLSDIIKQLEKAEEILDRPINPIIFQPTEFIKKLKAKDNFVTNVRSGQKIFVVGNENDLAGFTQQKTHTSSRDNP